MRIALLLVLLFGCKKADDKLLAGSCKSSPAVCEDYTSTDAKYIGRQRDACKGVGTWTDAACPTEGVVASCREEHGWTRTRRYYTPVDEKVKAECAAYGTWLSP